jgi:uncharacterized membrane protein YeaQ/YmgE (transglycosylase-associated protein family)
MSLLAWVFVGIVAGMLARWITRAERRGCLGTIAIGVLGAFIGGGLYRLLRGDDADVFEGIDLVSILVATLGAVALLLVLEAIGGRGGGRGGTSASRWG